MMKRAKVTGATLPSGLKIPSDGDWVVDRQQYLPCSSKTAAGIASMITCTTFFA